MIVFRINGIKNFGAYVLKNKEREEEMVFEFHGVPQPKVGDLLMIHEKLLDKKSSEYTSMVAFEFDEDEIPLRIKERDDKEYAVLQVEGKDYALKRIYG